MPSRPVRHVQSTNPFHSPVLLTTVIISPFLEAQVAVLLAFECKFRADLVRLSANDRLGSSRPRLGLGFSNVDLPFSKGVVSGRV